MKTIITTMIFALFALPQLSQADTMRPACPAGTIDPKFQGLWVIQSEDGQEKTVSPSHEGEKLDLGKIEKEILVLYNRIQSNVVTDRESAESLTPTDEEINKLQKNGVVVELTTRAWTCPLKNEKNKALFVTRFLGEHEDGNYENTLIELVNENTMKSSDEVYVDPDDGHLIYRSRGFDILKRLQ